MFAIYIVSNSIICYYFICLSNCVCLYELAECCLCLAHCLRSWELYYNRIYMLYNIWCNGWDNHIHIYILPIRTKPCDPKPPQTYNWFNYRTKWHHRVYFGVHRSQTKFRRDVKGENGRERGCLKWLQIDFQRQTILYHIYTYVLTITYVMLCECGSSETIYNYRWKLYLHIYLC